MIDIFKDQFIGNVYVLLRYSQIYNLNCKIDVYHLELWACDKPQARGMSLITKTEIFQALDYIEKEIPFFC